MGTIKSRMVVAAFLLVGLLGGVAWAEDNQMCVPMGDIVLKSISSEAKRAAVSFPHAVHFSYQCQKCHHQWNTESMITGCSTAGCHDLTEAPKDENGKPSKDAKLTIRYFKNAYHTMCIGCHKSIQQKNEIVEATQIQGGAKIAAAGPTGCIQCHPKEE
ncbi:MAG: cytochrome c3 family protein [Desulfobacteraceae bacterium]|nr:cytochrome c3 family protein [Desulfobacteraceae bacterium]